MRKRYSLIILIFLIGVFSFCFSVQSFAQQAYGGVYVIDSKINEIKDGQINGEFTVWNNEQFYLTGLNCAIKLLQAPSLGGQIIDVIVPKEIISVASGAKITKSFTYKYSKNIVSGEYVLRLQTITQKGSELGWEDKITELEGAGKFLNIDYSSAKLLFDGEEHPAAMGDVASPSQKITAIFKVKNPGEEINAVPRVKIFNRMYNMSLAKEQEYPEITFKKGQTQEITLEMPALNVPESYLAEVKFYKENEQVSPIQYFRWVVSGSGGKILGTITDKDYYKKDENIKINILVVGPADYSDIGRGQLEVSIYDNGGKLISTTTKEVTLNPRGDFLEFDIPSPKDLISPRVEAKLIKDGEILDEYKIELPVLSDGAKQLQRNMLIKYLLYWLIPIIIAVLLIAGFLFFKFKVRRV